MIVQSENLPKSIEKLAAQKELYFRAKRIFLLQIVFTILLTLIFTLVGMILLPFGYNIDWFRGVYGVLITVIDLFILNRFINKWRNQAAAIQEIFDCRVLNIECNSVLISDEPLPEDVKRYADKHLGRVKTFEKLTNWYATVISRVDGTAAKIICQRTNFSYDYAIRNSFLYWVIGVSVSLLLLLTLLAVASDFTMKAFFLTVILPFIPVLMLSVKLYNEHSSSVKNLESLNKSLKDVWRAVINGSDNQSEEKIRQIQDKIYLNRKSNPLIPEFVYDYLRPELETQMYYSAEELVDEYEAALESRKGV